ncbi:MAG TPA: type I-C CRISPR-associated protein Cas5c [Phycisphaerae bacterium]|nr:type I-C CRISPR-associated protein Cas5c [Phycisphaerae bacterium]
MKGFTLDVSGPYACFTRPEMKVERVSYDVMTPSAARAIFDAILWKPAIFWRVKRIEVLAPIRWVSVRRNEVDKTASPRSDGILIEEARQQRAGLFLRDVRYRLHAEFEFIPPDKRGQVYNPLPEWLVDPEEAAELQRPDLRPGETEAKYAAMFERRARRGQTFHHPYLGCREFGADVRLVDNGVTSPPPIRESRDLGWMLYDLDFSDPDNIRPLFFRARMQNGVIIVPDRDNKEEVRG